MAPRNTPDFDPFKFGLDAAAVEVSGVCSINIPTSLIPYLTTGIQGLIFPDVWKGSDSDVRRAIQIFETVIAEFAEVINNCNNNTGNNSGYDWSNPPMSNGCNDPCLPLKIEEGMLKMYSCGTWKDVGHVSGTDSGRDSIPDVEPELPEEQGSLSCLKAYVIGEYIWRVVDAFLLTMDDTFPSEYIDKIESRSGSQLDTPGVMGMVGTFWSQRLVFLDWVDTHWGTSERAEFICRLVRLMDGKTTSLSEREYDAIHSTMAITLNLDVIADGILQNAILAINKDRFSRAIRMAHAAQQVFDCGCPETEEDPESIPSGVFHTWSKIIDFTLGDYGFEPFGNGGATYEPGVGWTYSDTSFDSARLPKIRHTGASGAEPTKITYVRLHITGWPQSTVLGGGGYVFWQYDNQEIIGTEWVRQEWPTAFFQNPGGKSGSVMMSVNPSDMYWSASANPGYKAVVDKIILAGFEDDFWTRLNPDGTWE